MEKNNRSERPEIYALRQDGGDWQISRRDFLKAAGLGAAAISAGMGRGCSRSKPLDDICREKYYNTGPDPDPFHFSGWEITAFFGYRKESATGRAKCTELLGF